MEKRLLMTEKRLLLLLMERKLQKEKKVGRDMKERKVIGRAMKVRKAGKVMRKKEQRQTKMAKRLEIWLQTKLLKKHQKNLLSQKRRKEQLKKSATKKWRLRTVMPAPKCQRTQMEHPNQRTQPDPPLLTKWATSASQG